MIILNLKIDFIFIDTHYHNFFTTYQTSLTLHPLTSLYTFDTSFLNLTTVYQTQPKEHRNSFLQNRFRTQLADKVLHTYA